jgi:hypothetical protein
MKKALLIKVGVVLSIGFIMLIGPSEPVRIRAIPASCTTAPCIYKDAQGYAGLRLAEGDFSVNTFVIDLREDGNILDFFGLRIEDLTGLETARWVEIQVFVETTRSVTCNRPRNMSLSDFNKLMGLTPDQIGDEAAENCILIGDTLS